MQVVLALLVAAFGFQAAPVLADSLAASQDAAWGDLPDGVVHEPITEASIEEATLLASLVSVARVTLAPNTNRFQRATEPTAVVVEKGH